MRSLSQIQKSGEVFTSANYLGQKQILKIFFLQKRYFMLSEKSYFFEIIIHLNNIRIKSICGVACYGARTDSSAGTL